MKTYKVLLKNGSVFVTSDKVFAKVMNKKLSFWQKFFLIFK